MRPVLALATTLLLLPLAAPAGAVSRECEQAAADAANPWLEGREPVAFDPSPTGVPTPRWTGPDAAADATDAGLTCGEHAPSGTVQALARTARWVADPNGNPGEAPDFPMGAAVILRYSKCDGCFSHSVAPGWTCTEFHESDLEYAVECDPVKLGPKFMCANPQVSARATGTGSTVLGKLHCGDVSLECVATPAVARAPAGTCHSTRATTVAEEPPLLCYIEVDGTYTTSGEVVCFNDP